MIHNQIIESISTLNWVSHMASDFALREVISCPSPGLIRRERMIRSSTTLVLAHALQHSYEPRHPFH